MALRAIILSGGRSSRFGGVHKPGVDLGGQTVISRILAAIRALDSSAEVWVAGPAAGLTDTEAADVHVVREEPAFAGPLAGIAAAVAAIGAGDGRSAGAGDGRAAGDAADDDRDAGADDDRAARDAGADDRDAAGDTTLIIAGDMPLVTADHLGDLIAESTRRGAPVTGTDDRGKAQFLCAAWPHALLRQRLERIGDPANRAVRLLFAAGEPTVIAVDPDIVGDFDTADEFTRIRTRFDADRPRAE